MSTLLAVSKFLGGRNRERQRVDSTSNPVPINTLDSQNDIAPQDAPKNLPSKFSNVVSSTFISSPLSTLKARRTRTDSILESSSDANSLSRSSYFRTPVAENLPSKAIGPTKTNDVEERLRQSEMQNAELDGAKKRAQDLEERDQALIHSRDMQEKAQARIRELEDVLKSVEAGLNSKSQMLDALTIDPEELQSQIDTLKTDLQQAVSVSKTVEEERDRALDHAREANDAQVAAEARIQALEDDLTRKSEAVDKLTTDTDRMQTQIDALTTDILHSTSAYKDSQLHVHVLEDAQTTTTARIQELGNDVESTKAELSSNVEALVVLTTSSESLQSKIDALTADLRNSVVTSKTLEEERNQAQLRTSELEIAQTMAMARIQELEGDLSTTGEELTSKIRENYDLIASAAALQSQIDVVAMDLRMRVEELDQERIYVQVLTREGEEHRASSQKHSRDLEDQRDDAIVSAKNANVAFVEAQACIHALEDELSSQSQTISALTSTSGILESKVESLTTDLRDAVAVRKDMEDERDSALSCTRDLADTHRQAQARNRALEDALRSTKTELNSKAEVLDALTASCEAQRLQIDALKSDLHDALAIRKDIEAELDSVFVRARTSEEVHEKALAQIQALGDVVKSTKAEVSSKSQEIDALNSRSKVLQSEIDTLKSALHDALAVSKLREEERDTALIHIRDARVSQETAQVHIQELGNALKSTMDELSSKSQALDALTATSKALQSDIDALKWELQDALAISMQREEERDNTLILARESEDAHGKALERIRALEDALQSTSNHRYIP
ncbi:hypothetical protein BDN70DRAFT_881393 [Pholiota conissans]|uniref:Uncharacterized protein n=1 Tax=Pholiota conissans TaxID=109636 RepID=A0A9P5YXZ9_9AGAR|nr:hypothetical protein BDN70DRAFT_881393 [Pholiota conissans]